MNDSENDLMLFCVFPYVTIEEPVFIRNIALHPSQLVEENKQLCDRCKTHLKQIFNLFHWHNNMQINKMTYASIHIPKDDIERKIEFLRGLEKVYILLGYLCCYPHEKVEFGVLGNFDEVDYYLFYPDKWIFKDLVYCADPKSFQETTDDSTNRMEGYGFQSNKSQLMWATLDCRIYPEYIGFGTRQFHLSQALEAIQKSQEYLRESPGWTHILQERAIDSDLELRLFRSMLWYNRSCKSNVTIDLSLVYLAVAFETLLGATRDKDANVGEVRKRLWDNIRVLVGDVPRLRSWFEQFYNARSRIIHEGHWSNFKFHLVDENQIPAILKNNIALDEHPSYGYLVNYGHLVFRICLTAVSMGVYKTSQLDLKSQFFSNKDRLLQVKKELEEIDEPKAALANCVHLVKSLNEYKMMGWGIFDDKIEVESKLVIEVGERLVRRFLETKVSVSVDIQAKLDDILSEIPLPHDSNEHTTVRQKLIKLFQTSHELPKDKVIEPAIKDLEQNIQLIKIEELLNSILVDKRNNSMSEQFRSQLENAIELIEDIIIQDRLRSIAALSTNVSGDFVHRHNLYSLLDAYGQFVGAILSNFQVRWNLL
jgi:hypothetical protein